MFGIEISDLAVNELFTDAGVTATVTPVSSNSLYEVYNGKVPMFYPVVMVICSIGM